MSLDVFIIIFFLPSAHRLLAPLNGAAFRLANSRRKLPAQIIAQCDLLGARLYVVFSYKHNCLPSFFDSTPVLHSFCKELASSTKL